ncbi:hypothetical protein PM3016_2760 [Paenibacillus mucilaginosus 3016]|uniref:Uncharacterized protein n=1 Tax=Paenibacillus mucilaginosus 3016 TaxID=1116391 RepID=H6NHN9_9BACL|nr:hypothetical protein [Paenibacillus mucilaginosus]AFC29636.1 hypothetical protein PM3016_2760 [Paenibacillus mucilaginosus 3016]WFA18318.1 hypothetical protein ERY13_14090 [Paenibacillus mucilaginosus]
MKHSFWKLLHYEIDRFSKIYGAMALLTLVVQWVSTVWMAKGLVDRIEEEFRLSPFAYADRFGKVSFVDFGSNLFFMAPVALCAAAMLLYVFLIWYRDWFGKNSFIYRLLMLPASRMNIYWAKLGTILIFVFGLIAFQLVTLPLHLFTFNSIVPVEIRSPVTIAQILMRNDLFQLLTPLRVSEFFFLYVLGTAIVIILFTFILFERSYRLRGLIAGGLYLLGTTALLSVPSWLNDTWVPNFFYNNEIIIMECMAGLLIVSVSLWVSSYLIRYKISV